MKEGQGSVGEKMMVRPFFGQRALLFAMTVVLPLSLMVYSYLAPAIGMFAPVFLGGVILSVSLRIVFGILAKNRPESIPLRTLRRAAHANMAMFLVPGVVLAFWLPKILPYRQITSDVRLMEELARIRDTVAQYHQANGKYPESINVPRLPIWASAENDGLHYHPPTDRVLIRPGICNKAMLQQVGDEGKWVYDPENGYVFFACAGYQSKSRHPLYEL